MRRLRKIAAPLNPVAATVAKNTTTRSTPMQHLFDLATELGVQVEYADLTHLDRDGDYDAATRTIRLQSGMLYRLERSVLAHELIHAYRGDQKTMFGLY